MLLSNKCDYIYDLILTVIHFKRNLLQNAYSDHLWMQGNKGGFYFLLSWFSEFKDFSIKGGITFIISKTSILKVNFPVFKIAVL